MLPMTMTSVRRSPPLGAVLLAGAVLAVPANLDAQALPAAVGSEIDRIFAPWDRDDGPGCAVGVIRDGELVHGRGYGLANLDHGIPLTSESVLYLASMTKQFTSAMVANLALEGRLSLDDEVRRHVPELPDYGTPVRVRHLLHNVSGIRDYLDLMRLAELPFENVYTQQDILDLITGQRELNFEPGSRYLYSNSNFFLLSLLVERVTGLTLREYAERHFFQPLGMAHTHFHDDHTEIIRNRVLGYRPTGDGEYRMSHMMSTDWTGSGAGNLHTNLEDLARWDRNLLDPVVGSREWVALAETPGVLTTGDTIDYAFGLRVGEYKGLYATSHGGSWMGFRTHYVRFPGQRTSVAVLCNLGSINPGPLAERVATLVLRDEIDASLRPLTGEYRSAETGTAVRIRIQDGDLVLYRDGDRDATRLAPTGAPDRYRGVDGPHMEVRFERDGSGLPVAFTVDTGRAWGVRFDAIAAARSGGEPVRGR